MNFLFFCAALCFASISHLSDALSYALNEEVDFSKFTLFFDDIISNSTENSAFLLETFQSLTALVYPKLSNKIQPFLEFILLELLFDIDRLSQKLIEWKKYHSVGDIMYSLTSMEQRVDEYGKKLYVLKEGKEMAQVVTNVILIRIQLNTQLLRINELVGSHSQQITFNTFESFNERMAQMLKQSEPTNFDSNEFLKVSNDLPMLLMKLTSYGDNEKAKRLIESFTVFEHSVKVRFPEAYDKALVEKMQHIYALIDKVRGEIPRAMQYVYPELNSISNNAYDGNDFISLNNVHLKLLEYKKTFQKNKNNRQQVTARKRIDK